MAATTRRCMTRSWMVQRGFVHQPIQALRYRPMRSTALLCAPAAVAALAGTAHADDTTTTTAAPTLTVMTYNVNYGHTGRDETLDAIDAGNADLVLLQEITASWEKQLRKRFKTRYPHM